MKKPIFSLLILLMVLFVSCNLNPVPSVSDTSRSGDDGDDGTGSRELKRYVTLRFADSGQYVSDSIGIGIGNTVRDSRSESRTLTYDSARTAHDFFEVVFIYGNPGNRTIARAAWSIGETPELRGVHRTEGGVDYGRVDFSSAGIDNVNHVNNGGGHAVLFVGTKEDKTLLALGRLVDTEGLNGPTGTPVIYDDTRFVTFEVAAIKAGVGKTSGSPGSFRTYRPGDPDDTNPSLTDDATDIVENIYVNNTDNTKAFPLYRLGGPAGDSVRHGAYKFELEASGAPVTYSNPPDFNSYAAGIVLADGGLYRYSALFEQLTTDMMNNTSAGDPLENPVVFKFDTSASQDGSVFALAFEIFVYNLSSADSSNVRAGVPSAFPKPVKWRVSTGYGTYWLDMDDGSFGNGGAVFLCTGDVARGGYVR